MTRRRTPPPKLVPEDALRFLRSLRAVRRFRPDPVSADVVRDVLAAARWTGSAQNRQPWQFVVIRERATIDGLAQLGPFTEFFVGAPLCVAVLMDGERTGSSYDCGRVSQTLMLAAHAHGVGSCNAGLGPEENQRAGMTLLGIPEGHSLGQVIAFGYRAAGDQLAPPGGIDRPPLAPAGRKPLEELVHYERFGRREPPEQQLPLGLGADA